MSESCTVWTGHARALKSSAEELETMTEQKTCGICNVYPTTKEVCIECQDRLDERKLIVVPTVDLSTAQIVSLNNFIRAQHYS